MEVDGVSYSADHIVIATGGRPVFPPVPGAMAGGTDRGQCSGVAVYGVGQ
ncbi:MAG: hypothetical protein RQ936_02580 [Gammaproteobacteria bacterium]|nr:hypothetical protein [Gammaproteobacteria bacterium]